MVAPNPFLEQLSFFWNSENDSKVTIRIYDSLGQLVANDKKSNLLPGSNWSLDLPDLPTGQYTIQLITENGMEVIPVVKGNYR